MLPPAAVAAAVDRHPHMLDLRRPWGDSEIAASCWMDGQVLDWACEEAPDLDNEAYCSLDCS